MIKLNSGASLVPLLFPTLALVGTEKVYISGKCIFLQIIFDAARKDLDL